MTWGGAPLGWAWRRIVALGAAKPTPSGAARAGLACTLLLSLALPADAGATTVAAHSDLRGTVSHYEPNTRLLRLYLQGEAAGKTAAQGIVILDFGRPAYQHGGFGTIDFDDRFVTFGHIATAVESYIAAYFLYAPADTVLHVAIGTNNSCGTGQPCGTTTCGCSDEPPNYATWGAVFAATVLDVGLWAAALRETNGYTDQVRVIAADDAEPAYDPGYANTYDVLEGYAQAIGGTSPAMVDYGSADPHYWTEAQLLQVAYGFAPDVAMPEIYYREDAFDWAALLRYAKDQRGEMIDIYGVLAGGPGTNSAEAAYSDMVSVAEHITHQSTIPWLSTMPPPKGALPGH